MRSPSCGAAVSRAGISSRARSPRRRIQRRGVRGQAGDRRPEQDARAGRQYAADARLLDRDRQRRRRDGVHWPRGHGPGHVDGADAADCRGALGPRQPRDVSVAVRYAMTPDQGTSSGSQAHPVNFNHEQPRAGAARRRARSALAAIGVDEAWARRSISSPRPAA